MVDNFRNSEAGRALVFFDQNGNPQTVLEFYGMVDDPILSNAGACLGLLATILVFFTVLGVLSLAYIRHDKRWVRGDDAWINARIHAYEWMLIYMGYVARGKRT